MSKHSPEGNPLVTTYRDKLFATQNNSSFWSLMLWEYVLSRTFHLQTMVGQGFAGFCVMTVDEI